MSQHVATGWPNACNILRLTMLRSVAFKCCNRLARACKCWANNVGICCVEMLLSFGRGFRMFVSFVRFLMKIFPFFYNLALLFFSENVIFKIKFYDQLVIRLRVVQFGL